MDAKGRVKDSRSQLPVSPQRGQMSLDIFFCLTSIKFGLPHSGQHRSLYCPREKDLINAGIYWYSLALKKKKKAIVVSWIGHYNFCYNNLLLNDINGDNYEI